MTDIITEQVLILYLKPYLMAKVEEFIPYSIVVFDVTFVYDDNAHTVIFDV